MTKRGPSISELDQIDIQSSNNLEVDQFGSAIRTISRADELFHFIPKTRDEAESIFQEIDEEIKKYFYVAGGILRTVQINRWYKSYGTFEKYCNTVLNFSRDRAYQLIKARNIADILLKGKISLPENDFLLRPLFGLSELQIIECWDRAIEIQNEINHNRLTAEIIQQAVDELYPKGGIKNESTIKQKVKKVEKEVFSKLNKEQKESFYEEYMKLLQKHLVP